MCTFCLVLVPTLKIDFQEYPLLNYFTLLGSSSCLPVSLVASVLCCFWPICMCAASISHPSTTPPPFHPSTPYESEDHIYIRNVYCRFPSLCLCQLFLWSPLLSLASIYIVLYICLVSTASCITPFLMDCPMRVEV